MKKLLTLCVLGGVGAALYTSLKQRVQEARPAWPCVASGHSDVLVFSGPRIFTRCGVCGQESPGVNVLTGTKEQVA